MDKADDELYSANITSIEKCSSHGTAEPGRAVFRTTRTLSVKAGAAAKQIKSLLRPRGKQNCGQHLHTLPGGVHGSRVFAMVFLLPLKRLAKVC